jgi:hypothetical protein
MRRSEVGKPLVWIALATAVAGCGDFGGDLGPYDGSPSVFVSPGDPTPSAPNDANASGVHTGDGSASGGSLDDGGTSDAEDAKAEADAALPAQSSPSPTGDAAGMTTTSNGDAGRQPDAGPPPVTPDTGVALPPPIAEAGVPEAATAVDAQPEAAADSGATRDSEAQETGAPETGAPDSGGADAPAVGMVADAESLDGGARDANVPVTDGGSGDATVTEGGPATDAGDLCDPTNPAARTLDCLKQQDKKTTTDATLVCSTCAVANGCLDPAQQGGTCEGTAGNATLFTGTLPDGKTCSQVFAPLTSPVSETSVCLAVLRMVFTSKCAESLQETVCVCGTVDVGSCTSGAVQANGPGFDMFACDLDNTNIGTINATTNFTVKTFGAGQANRLVQCAAINGCDCF